MTEPGKRFASVDQKPSLVRRLASDRLQWVAAWYFVAGSSLSAWMLHLGQQQYGTDTYGLLAITGGSALLGLAYTVDNVISHYRGMPTTYVMQRFTEYEQSVTDQMIGGSSPDSED